MMHIVEWRHNAASETLPLLQPHSNIYHKGPSRGDVNKGGLHSTLLCTRCNRPTQKLSIDIYQVLQLND